ncbi:MAG: hypothetical protein H6713_40480 [Myxococcales bacterium]|nr:hypothetical protein [Myxococcales bacterium]MCB9756238.1 hypothetical protein [Myxococcales bacterium]
MTGTKRSGTSLWMQILIAAGYPAIGEAFPRRWSEHLKDANPSGFFESALRQGVYYRTNPDPRTGHFLFPADVVEHVVKVFIPGLVRTDLAFVHRVIATIRPWREYVMSMRRLYALEDARARASGSTAPRPVRPPPHLEWWSENFALIGDIGTRRYPVHVQSFDRLLAEPEEIIGRVLDWIGRRDRLAQAVAAVRPEHRTQRAPPLADEERFDDDAARVCDELYERVDDGRGLEPDFIRALNELNARLQPELRRRAQAVRAAARQRTRASDGLALLEGRDAGDAADGD